MEMFKTMKSLPESYLNVRDSLTEATNVVKSTIATAAVNSPLEIITDRFHIRKMV